MLIGAVPATCAIQIGSCAFMTLANAKVLDLWCTPCYQKEKVSGWFIVEGMDVIGGLTLTGPYLLKQTGDYKQIFIDQEIE